MVSRRALVGRIGQESATNRKMNRVDASERRRLAELFQGITSSYLPDSVLDGAMGEAFTDSLENPHVAILEVPALKLSILGGDARHPLAAECVAKLPIPRLVMIRSKEWEQLLNGTHRGRLLRISRYACTSESLDLAHLKQLKSQLADDYRLERIDAGLAAELASDRCAFAAEHMQNFDSPDDFVERGFGFCILHQGEIVSAATTYAICDRGIEIQIDTRKDHRRRGLALSAGAQLLIHSLERNLDPNWDADNQASVKLAKKLGYTPIGTYPIYVLVRSRTKALYGKAFLTIQRLLRG